MLVSKSTWLSLLLGLLIAVILPMPSHPMAIGRKKTRQSRGRRSAPPVAVAPDDNTRILIEGNEDASSSSPPLAIEALWDMAGRSSRRKRQRGGTAFLVRDNFPIAALSPNHAAAGNYKKRSSQVTTPSILREEIESVTVSPSTDDADATTTIMANVLLVNGTKLSLDPRELHQRHETDVWLAVRSAMDVTASEFSAVLNNSFFTSREKLMSVKRGEKPAFTGNTKACQWGLRMEPRALSQYCQVTGNTVNETGLHILNSGAGNGFKFGASPDGLVVDNNNQKNPNNGMPSSSNDTEGLLEIKCLWGRRNKKELPQFDHCPNRFYDQIQGQLAVCDKEWCDLMMYIPPSNKNRKNYCILRIERNRHYWTETLLPALDTFCNELYGNGVGEVTAVVDDETETTK